jgi:hypothetical protein
MKKILMLLVLVCVLFVSCSKEKKMVINGKETTVVPYGWANMSEKNDSVVYKVSVNDVIVSIIFSETIIVPIVSTGWYIFEPVGKK